MNTNLNADDKVNFDDKLFALNIPGKVIEVTVAEAQELGAFEENALTEDEALEASDEIINDEE
ncbi:conjugal transfer protein TraD [Parashewanella spongiae]|uniref:Conjugal transfer protein TraD n=1 Tax=Parashewanella spongiae TaxID=342950 RepID=A0A3A6T7H0_9GAMM|nr:conjugal transfer protein TraD [Parashewanella spongiae]MCL1079440.1 hypothetical protein [Parashewanella spongiae]RJY07553.1 conjugal transfer protein TraD [Parashewanella spongiae]